MALTAVHRQAKARRIAELYARDQAELDKLLLQFGPAHKRALLERLRPHLKFEPKPLPAHHLLHLE
jgi:hypothetical protein